MIRLPVIHQITCDLYLPLTLPSSKENQILHTSPYRELLTRQHKGWIHGGYHQMNTHSTLDMPRLCRSPNTTPSSPPGSPPVIPHLHQLKALNCSHQEQVCSMYNWFGMGCMWRRTEMGHRSEGSWLEQGCKREDSLGPRKSRGLDRE